MSSDWQRGRVSGLGLCGSVAEGGEWQFGGCLSQTVMTSRVSALQQNPTEAFSYKQALLSTSFSCVSYFCLPREEALCLFFFPSVRTLQRLFMYLGIKNSN